MVENRLFFTELKVDPNRLIHCPVQQHFSLNIHSRPHLCPLSKYHSKSSTELLRQLQEQLESRCFNPLELQPRLETDVDHRLRDRQLETFPRNVTCITNYHDNPFSAQSQNVFPVNERAFREKKEKRKRGNNMERWKNRVRASSKRRNAWTTDKQTISPRIAVPKLSCARTTQSL